MQKVMYAVRFEADGGVRLPTLHVSRGRTRASGRFVPESGGTVALVPRFGASWQAG
jgi:hypothetical protein